MPKFQFKYTEEIWLKVDITAEDQAEAMMKFWQGDFDHKPEMYGNHIQEDIDIEELEEN